MALFYRTLFFIIGLFIMTFGICLTIKAELGVGAWDALNVALTQGVGLTIGTWVIIDGAVLILVNALLIKKRPEILSLFTIILIGSLVDFWILIVFKSWEATGFIIQLATLVLGLFIIAVGAAIYLQAKFPSSPFDSFMMAIQKRFGVNLMTAKTIGEIIALIPALFLKGPIGFGTIIITFLIGPFIQLCFPYFEKLLNKLIASSYVEKY
ncbi:YczE/YyaS/YitT family protein [Neobacillus vireti]|uniref:YczE/YyaS/YitT family protein n=1 Tax=Neobacillus vireti TaxID=220686 RepID=UPI002FFEF8A3